MSSRLRPIRGRRVDTPPITMGSLVWWRAGLYRVENIELHGQHWTAVLVRPDEVGAANAKCWFANCSDLQIESAPS